MADKKSFRDMKTSMDKATDRMIRAVSADKTFSKGSRYVGRIREAVSGTDIGARMNACASGVTKCGSVFCVSCRDRKQRGMLKAFKDHIERYDADEKDTRRQLRWVSVLHSVVSVRYETGDAEQACLNEVQAAVKQMKLDLKNLQRTAVSRESAGANNHLWLRGAIHIELVDYDIYQFAGSLGGKATNKERTLKELIRQLPGYDDRGGKFFLIHFHYQ